MRFRVVHLLIAAVVVAGFAWALANPSDVWVGAVAFATWLLFAYLACRAVCRPAERPVLVCAIVVGASYLWVSQMQPELSTSALLGKAFDAWLAPSTPDASADPFADDPFGPAVPSDAGYDASVARYQFQAIGRYAAAIVFGLSGAVAAGLLSRRPHERTA